MVWDVCGRSMFPYCFVSFTEFRLPGGAVNEGSMPPIGARGGYLRPMSGLGAQASRIEAPTPSLEVCLPNQGLALGGRVAQAAAGTANERRHYDEGEDETRAAQTL
jgi:hypothetical protein